MSIAEKLTIIAENIPKVYDAGVAEGKQNVYDIMWDNIQQNGTRRIYNTFFQDWTEETFRPKYDMNASDPTSMFKGFKSQISLKERLNEQGVKLNFASCTYFNYVFQNAAFTELPEINVPNTTQLGFSFEGCTYLETIEKLIIPAGVDIGVTTFRYCTALKNITLAGVLSKQVNFASCSQLTAESITSIVDVLSTTSSGQTLTLSKKAVNTAFETSEGAADGSTSQEWLDLIATKSNWTISLV